FKTKLIMRKVDPFRILLIPFFITLTILVSSFFQDSKIYNDSNTSYTPEAFTRDCLLLLQYRDLYHYHWKKVANYDSMFYYAEKMYEHSGEILEKHHDSLLYVAYVKGYCDMGFANLYRGKYDEVQEYLEGAIQLAKAEFGENSTVLVSLYIGYNAYLAEKGE